MPDGSRETLGESLQHALCPHSRTRRAIVERDFRCVLYATPCLILSDVRSPRLDIPHTAEGFASYSFTTAYCRLYLVCSVSSSTREERRVGARPFAVREARTPGTRPRVLGSLSAISALSRVWLAAQQKGLSGQSRPAAREAGRITYALR